MNDLGSPQVSANTESSDGHRPGAHPARGFAERAVARPLALLAFIGALAACASPPKHYPSQTAQTYVGKPLFALEMRWSTPSSSDEVKGGGKAKWDFDQYNYAGCSVTVRTDRAGIIRKITWTRGCGPQPKKH